MDIINELPAPWSVCDKFRGKDGDVFPIKDADGAIVASGEYQDIAEFIALARNAFGVQIRRGWSAKRGADGRWFVDTPTRIPFDGGSIRLHAADPLTALVEADKWYTANVEQRREAT